MKYCPQEYGHAYISWWYAPSEKTEGEVSESAEPPVNASLSTCKPWGSSTFAHATLAPSSIRWPRSISPPPYRISLKPVSWKNERMATIPAPIDYSSYSPKPPPQHHSRKRPRDDPAHTDNDDNDDDDVIGTYQKYHRLDQEEEQPVDQLTTPAPLRCTITPSCAAISFTSVSEYEAHHENNHVNVCDTCRKTLPTRRILELHIMEVHDSYFAVLTSRGQKMYACLDPACPKMFANQNARRLHLVAKHAYAPDYHFEVVVQGGEGEVAGEEDRRDGATGGDDQEGGMDVVEPVATEASNQTSSGSGGPNRKERRAARRAQGGQMEVDRGQATEPHTASRPPSNSIPTATAQRTSSTRNPAIQQHSPQNNSHAHAASTQPLFHPNAAHPPITPIARLPTKTTTLSLPDDTELNSLTASLARMHVNLPKTVSFGYNKGRAPAFWRPPAQPHEGNPDGKKGKKGKGKGKGEDANRSGEGRMDTSAGAGEGLLNAEQGAPLSYIPLTQPL
ncbi:uncharacterized protein EV422DRAFT_240598 [Fimicolochytrium jonesii]|uniref:uncharacterized protein n=1 Tax=Fimicolochytrium jonesii TaxID=1396493 RepID=UPI0022FF3CF4|nr:uncharacterized protein EV422DRAFT_240598 [Fimicolochytrium jonesii]KAI8824989.1 hypothetical protein EV422DRAFT_240598 [Fimicolochytrium jonesii]